MSGDGPKKPKIVRLAGGVTIAPVEHPRYRWRVTYQSGDTRKQSYFKTKAGESGATAFAEAKSQELTLHGNGMAEITNEERAAVLAFRELQNLLPDAFEKPKLSDAVRAYEQQLLLKAKSQTINELCDSMLASLTKSGCGKRHFDTLQQRLRRFSSDYGTWLACDINEEIITDWLDQLGVAPLTTNHYRAVLNQLFKHALKRNAIAANPVDIQTRSRVLQQEPGILAPEQISQILDHASLEILPALALGFFAGIRRAELGRMDWSEIDFEQELVEVKAAKAKTAARRLIKLRPNLRAWLLRCSPQTGIIMPTEQIWRSRLKQAMVAASISEWPHNAPRHSFASYHLAHFKDAPALALEMGHMTTTMIFQNYRALVTPQAAEKYWAISPSNSKAMGTITSAKHA